MIRRGQTEMIGLVIIVVLLVLGIAIYVSIGSRDRSPDALEAGLRVQGSSSFIVAFSEITVPSCSNLPLSRVARACVEREVLCTFGDPCAAVQDALDMIAEQTIDVEGVRYNVSLSGTSVQRSSVCDASMNRVAASPLPILLSGGGSASLLFTVCANQ